MFSSDIFSKNNKAQQNNTSLVFTCCSIRYTPARLINEWINNHEWYTQWSCLYEYTPVGIYCVMRARKQQDARTVRDISIESFNFSMQ